MKRYNSTPNRLSYTSGKYPPPAKPYTSNYLIPLIILAIVLGITLCIYKSCNHHQTHQITEPHRSEQTSNSVNKNDSKKIKKTISKKQNAPVDTIPKDSLPPETDLRILTDK
ncbi:MAG: hypothetical protein QHH74_09125 [Spirochaetota bacterium]|nr:hypothetical protein [Spirochaetota bacterium]